MQIGERIKRIREFRKLSQKELGTLINFNEKSAQVRFSHYESGVRVPKKETALLLGTALKCNPAHFMQSSDLGLGESTMIDMFWLEERFGGSMQIFQLEKYNDKEDSRKAYGMYNDYTFDTVFPPVAITMNYTLINDFMREWAFRFKELSEKKITPEEYFEWKLNWPQTCDDGGRFEPSHEWRNT